MKIFHRINDIFCANIHEMMDRFEDPEAMLKQAIREMEESIENVSVETAKAIAGEKRLAKELASNELEAQQWNHRAEQAVQNEDDHLARKALSRKKECQNLAQAIREQLEGVKKATDTLKNQLAAMNAKLAEAKRHLAGLLIRKKAADIRKQSATSLDPKFSAPFSSSAFRKFDRLREKVEEAEAEADALSELQLLGGQSLADFDAQAGTHGLEKDFTTLDIEDELSQLKLKKKSP